MAERSTRLGAASLTQAQRRVASALLEYGRELAEAGAAQTGGSFTDIPEADALIKSDPNVFLLGAIFTQGIPAERAWAGPYLLKRRLGHLDLRRLAEEPDAVREALQRPPMLHRFKNHLPAWISATAGAVLEDYDGDASRIWAPGTRVLEVIRRLEALPGIGRKKAAMATEILMRHFGAELAGAEQSEVAFDVHVRRVFLRSGLSEEDTPDAVREAARLSCPEAPGLLDLPTWLIGRDRCRPREPRCGACRLGAVCPRRIGLNVEGVGVRKGRRI